MCFWKKSEAGWKVDNADEDRQPADVVDQHDDDEKSDGDESDSVAELGDDCIIEGFRSTANMRPHGAWGLIRPHELEHEASCSPNVNKHFLLKVNFVSDVRFDADSSV